MRCTGAIKVSESNMDEGQAAKKAKRHISSSAFYTARNDVRCFGRVAACVATVSRNEGYLN